MARYDTHDGVDWVHSGRGQWPFIGGWRYHVKQDAGCTDCYNA